MMILLRRGRISQSGGTSNGKRMQDPAKGKRRSWRRTEAEIGKRRREAEEDEDPEEVKEEKG